MDKIKIIERFDNYYCEINNKAIFILTINTFLIGAFLIGYKNLELLVEGDIQKWIFKITVLIVLLLSVASMLFTILAIFPYLTSNKKSFWFFNDIANRTLKEFIESIDKQTTENKNEDINNQIYYLASGLKKKHMKVRVSLVLNFIQFIILVLVILLMIFS